MSRRKWLAGGCLLILMTVVGFAVSGNGRPGTPQPTFSLIPVTSTSRHEFMANGMFEQRYSYASYDFKKPYKEVVAKAQSELQKGTWSSSGSGPLNFLKGKPHAGYKQDEWEVWIYEETSPRVTRVLIGCARGPEWKARVQDKLHEFF